MKICHELSDKVEILEDIFAENSVKGLHQLLPKISEYDNPPEIRGSELENNLEDYRKYLKAMAYIFKEYKEEAAQVACNETINFSEKIAPFINPDLMLQKEAFSILEAIRGNKYNCHILYKFLHHYGSVDLET